MTPDPLPETISDQEFFAIMDNIFQTLPAWYRSNEEHQTNQPDEINTQFFEEQFS
jgi:hypothetical protein